MKQLLAIQAVLFFGNGLLKKPFNWWLICCPLLAYAAYEVIYYVWEEQRLSRLDRERKQQGQASTINRAKLKDELNKNLN